MKKIILAFAAVAFAAPAFAQTPNTLQEVTTKGIKMAAGGFELNVDYKPDGTFTAMDGQITGKWRIDGDKMCTSSNFNPTEECAAYPTGKKSGDSFEVTGSQGTAMITIR